MNWKSLTFPDLDAIAEAREQYHQAVQNVAAIGRSLNPAAEDDHFANLEWDPAVQRLVGRWVGDDRKFRSSISFTDFKVYLVDEKLETIASFDLQDQKQTTVMLWLEEKLDELGVDSGQLTLKLPYEIPEYPTSKGQPFHLADHEGGQALGSYFHNTHLLLSEVVSPLNGASEIKCWPHHFDIASLITLNDTGDPETSKSIGVGFSPGDDNYTEPYFYVTPWPYPSEEKLTDISGTKGFWHTENWIGAILTSTQIAQVNAEDQQNTIKLFFEKAIEVLTNIS